MATVMKWIGLTGGIATGKSTVARLVESLGSKVIDADQLAHEVMRFGGAAYDAVVSQFGTEILKPDQQIDRKKLGEIVFSDVTKKEILESIIHPLIKDEVTQLKNKYEQQGEHFCFYDVPLLFENNLQKNFDFTVTVWCEPEIQLQRLIQRNQLTKDQALQRIQNQWPLSQKIALSQYCIDNSGSEESLIQIVSSFLNLIR